MDASKIKKLAADLHKKDKKLKKQKKPRHDRNSESDEETQENNFNGDIRISKKMSSIDLDLKSKTKKQQNETYTHKLEKNFLNNKDREKNYLLKKEFNSDLYFDTHHEVSMEVEENEVVTDDYYKMLPSDEDNPLLEDFKEISHENNIPITEQPEPSIQNNVEIVEEESLTNKPNIIFYYPAFQGCRSVEEYQCLNRIEEGTYGVVYRAKNKRTDQVVALKRLKMEKEKEGFPITSLREINTLMKAHHPNVVSILEIVVGSNMDKIYIVMEFIEHDLKSLMETMKRPFLIGEVKTLLIQLLRGVHHLHDNWILHRDIKASNVLLSHTGILKLGDFGLAREYGSPLKPYTPVVVTLWYRAPELLLGTELYSTAIDTWSVGCLLGELLTLKPLFQGKSEVDQLNKIYKDLGTPNEFIWAGYSDLPMVKKINFITYPYNNIRKRFNSSFLSDSGFDLLSKFLTYDPTIRYTAEEGISHNFFSESPLPVNPSLLPTFPAKSEQYQSSSSGSHHVHPAHQQHSPKPPSGGKQYQSLMKSEAAGDDYAASQARIKAQLIAANLNIASHAADVITYPPPLAPINFDSSEVTRHVINTSSSSLPISKLATSTIHQNVKSTKISVTRDFEGNNSRIIHKITAAGAETSLLDDLREYKQQQQHHFPNHPNDSSPGSGSNLPPQVLQRHYNEREYIDPSKASAYLFKSMGSDAAGDHPLNSSPPPPPPGRRSKKEQRGVPGSDISKDSTGVVESHYRTHNNSSNVRSSNNNNNGSRKQDFQQQHHRHPHHHRTSNIKRTNETDNFSRPTSSPRHRSSHSHHHKHAAKHKHHREGSDS